MTYAATFRQSERFPWARAWRTESKRKQTKSNRTRKKKLSWNFCTFGTDLHAQLVLIDKVYASELSRKFIKKVMLVGSASRKK